MRLLIATAALLAAVTARASCVDGVCIPWLDLEDPVRVGLRIAPATPAGGVLTLRKIDDARRWTFRGTAAQIAELRAIMLLAGSYQLTVELERHRPAMRKIDVAPGRPFDFGAVGVTRMPRIEGEVRRANGKPLAGARVALHPPGAAVTTGVSGRFAIDVAGHWPSELVVSRAGHGTRVVGLDRTEGDAAVPPVTLRRGNALRVRIARGAEAGPIDVQAAAMIDGNRPVPIARRTLAPGESSVVFDDLDRDAYALVLSGREPLQKMVVMAVVNQQRKTIDVSIPEARARGAVTLGGEPVRGASVELFREKLWSASVITDAKGEFESAAWETADLSAKVTGGGLPSPRLIRLRAGGGLNIDLPARELRGQLVDDRGRPVTRARIALEVEQDEIHAYIRTQPDAEGRFAFAGLDAGRYALHADAEGHLRIDPVEVEIADDRSVTEQRIVLRTAYPRALEIVDRDGRPAAGAAVVCAVDGRIRAAAQTDTDGRATIGTPAEASVLFVIPREGSLAVVRLRPALEDAAPLHRIAVPPGEAKLDITALATGDMPLAGISLLMRFNGELFTPEIARELRLSHRSNLRTGEDGRATLTQIPAGYYEFWPYQSAEEAELLMQSSVAMAAPIALHVAAGENQVKVRFETPR